MKQCPRCKSALSKSHSQKLVCRACGFITRNLEVARDNQQFQQHYGYNKKISHIKSTEQPLRPGTQQQLRSHYLLTFQNILREAANALSKSDKGSGNIEIHARHIWLMYCNLASRNGVDVAGIFRALLSNKPKPVENNQAAEKREQLEQGMEIKVCDEGQQQNQPENGPEGETKKRRKGRPKKKGLSECLSTNEQKKVSLAIQVSRKYKQLQNQASEEGLSLSEQRALFLKFLYSQVNSEEEGDAKTIELMAQKYAALLVREMYEGYQGVFGISEAKGRPLKLTNKELQGLMKMRSLSITDRNQMIMVLLLEDLLREWSVETSLEKEHSLEDLLLLYTSEQNSNTKPLLTSIIEQVKSLMSSPPESQSGKQLPELSFTLLYAILYLASLMNCNTLSIDDIVAMAGRVGLCFQFQGEKVRSEERVCNEKVRKTAAAMAALLSIQCQPTVLSLSKWVQKYVEVCQLTKHTKHILKLTEVLWNSDQLLKRQSPSSEGAGKSRPEFLEQDIIAKSIIVIFIKLEVGFQREPYLSTTPARLLHLLQSCPRQQRMGKYIAFLQSQSLWATGQAISIGEIISGLEQQYGDGSARDAELKQRYSADNYSSLECLSLKQLTRMARANISQHFQFRPNLVRDARKTPLHPSPRAGRRGRGQGWALSRAYRKQLEVAMEEQARGEFEAGDLDVPSCNYQFFYQYMSNIKHAGRELFVTLAESLAARECPMKDLYGWVERLERGMLDYQS